MDTEELVKWIVRNVTSSDVPRDEGNDLALVYNLVQLARYGWGYKSYDYLPEQDEEIKSLFEQYSQDKP